MANQRLRALFWLTKWAKRDWAIAAVGFTIIIFVLTFFFDSSSTDEAASSLNLPASDLVDLTLLHNAKDRGALCLDGSLPGYHFQKGFGSGSNNWLVHIEVLHHFSSLIFYFNMVFIFYLFLDSF